MIYQCPKVIRRLVLGFAVLVAAGSPGANAADAPAGPPPPPVTVATPLAKRIVNWDEYSGRLDRKSVV